MDATNSVIPYEWAVELMTLDEVIDECEPATQLRKFLGMCGLSLKQFAHAHHETMCGRTMGFKRSHLPPNLEQADAVTQGAWRHVVMGDEFDPSQLGELYAYLAAVAVSLHQWRDQPKQYEEFRRSVLRRLTSVGQLGQFIDECTPIFLV